MGNEVCPHCDGLGHVYDRGRDVLFFDSCPHCRKERVLRRVQECGIRTRSGELYNREFVEGLFNAGAITREIYEISKIDEIKPLMLSGESGIGKSVLLRALYNKALYLENGYSNRVRIWTEKDLVDTFRDEEQSFEFFKRIDFKLLRYVFLDEMLDPANWVDRYADRHFSNLKHSNLWRFIDDLYDSGATVVMATNTDPLTGKMPSGAPFFDLSHEHDAKIVRRILEMTGNYERWKIASRDRAGARR